MASVGAKAESAPLRANPHLYEINTWVWLEELSAREGKYITLTNVPEADWDRISSRGFDLVWLMGVWQRSPASRRIFQTEPETLSELARILPGWKLEHIVGSPYAVREYTPDPRVGGWNALDRAREKLRARGIALLLDFVPNHTALDHPWTAAHPEFYFEVSHDEFERDPHAYFLAHSGGAVGRFLALAKDPFLPPWKDTAQLNVFHPAARAALLRELQTIAGHCDGVRCDMAMLILNDIFRKNWSHMLGNQPPPKQEFWSEVRDALPNLRLLAEAYWGTEERLLDLGFSYAYDKGLYDDLRDGRITGVRSRLAASVELQSRLARFLENHDEARAAQVFGTQRLESVGTLMATVPGMRFFHHGQLEGRKIHPPLALGSPVPEAADPVFVTFYEKILRITKDDAFHSGAWRLIEVAPEGDASHENLIVYEWRSPKAWKVIVANLSAETSQGRVHLTDIAPSSQYIFYDQLHDARYPRSGDELSRLGLFVRLGGFQAHVFDVTPAR